MHGKNRDTQRDGTIKDGHYTNHLMHGNGRIMSPNGFVQQGVYEKGTLIEEDILDDDFDDDNLDDQLEDYINNTINE